MTAQLNLAPIASVWHTPAGLAALISTCLLIGGCAEKAPPLCSDPTTLSLLNDAFDEAVTQGLVFLPEPERAERKKELAAATKFSVEGIATTSKDEQTGKQVCEATVTLKLPSELAKGLAMPGNIFMRSNRPLPYAVRGEQMENPVRYIAQMTDDKKAIKVGMEGDGVTTLGQFMGVLARAGVFKPGALSGASAPASAAEPAGPMVSTVPSAPAPSATVVTQPLEGSTRADPEPVESQANGGTPATPGQSAQVVAPSFSCAGKLNSVEKLICDTPSLAKADTDLSRAYTAALGKAADAGAFKQQQRDWRKARDACSDVACIQSAYDKRLAELPR